MVSFDFNQDAWEDQGSKWPQMDIIPGGDTILALTLSSQKKPQMKKKKKNLVKPGTW